LQVDDGSGKSSEKLGVIKTGRTDRVLVRARTDSDSQSSIGRRGPYDFHCQQSNEPYTRPAPHFATLWGER